jgi:hypothetical protein
MLRAARVLHATKSILSRASDPIPSPLFRDFLWRDISDAKNAIERISLYSLERIDLVEEFEAEFEEEWQTMETGSVERRDLFLEEKDGSWEIWVGSGMRS